MDSVTLRSCILPALMRKTLLRGTFLGVLGGAVLIAGAFISPESMSPWGAALYVFSLVLITVGLLPYKRLKRLEGRPDRLTIDTGQELHFFTQDKSVLSVPLCSIDHMAYLDQGNHYGIRIFLKDPLPKKLVVHDPGFSLVHFRARSLSVHSCDLFLAYFSKRTFSVLQDYLNENAGEQE